VLIKFSDRPRVRRVLDKLAYQLPSNTIPAVAWLQLTFLSAFSQSSETHATEVLTLMEPTHSGGLSKIGTERSSRHLIAAPRLAGQLHEYTSKTLMNGDKERGRDPTKPDTSAIMEPIARNLSESQIAAVAAYLNYLR
jgi:hypothetical protein